MNALKQWLRAVPEALLCFAFFGAVLLVWAVLTGSVGAEPDPQSPHAVSIARRLAARDSLSLRYPAEERRSRVLPVPPGPTCPLTFAECLNRDVLVDLADAGAEPWELDAVAVIISGDEGKGPVDYVRVGPNEIAVGFAHFTACRDRFRLGIGCDPNTTTLAAWEGMLALLYSDVGPSVQLTAWRRIVSRPVAEARRWGLHGSTLSAVAALGNSAPTMVAREVHECRGDLCCVARAYATTDHRVRRIEALGLEGCL